MKRAFASACTLFLLASCIQQSPLPPDQVLQKATEEMGTLNSAHFNLHATVSGNTQILPANLDGVIDASGDMQNGGNQLSFTVHADLQQASDSTTRFNGQADIVVAGQNDVYMKLDSLTVTPESALLPQALILQLLDQWWHMPSGSGAIVQTDVTPDPNLLRMQTQVITVRKDDGMTSVAGRRSYHYDIGIDPDKLTQYMKEIERRRNSPGQPPDLSSLNAQGQIWIDASTYDVRQLTWNLSSTNPAQPFQATIVVTLTNQNAPVTITPPAGAKPFPVGGLPAAANPVSSSASSGG
ncbi:MAG TPA: hypothetical protein VHA78_01330 [Candidatus Peribacteraceae bacterium]|nr:hypothetical protein [Candidatus Peribacteraceae bacterium]